MVILLSAMSTSIFHLQFPCIVTPAASKVGRNYSGAHLQSYNPRLELPYQSTSKFAKTILLPGSRKMKVSALAPDDGGEKKVPLWRKELNSLDNQKGTDSAFDSEFLQNASMEQDIERLRQKRDLEKRTEEFQRSSKTPVVEDEGDGFAKTVIEKVLVADFFFILFILAWLVAGLGERSVLGATTLIDSWLPLWPTLFQPALGLFMAGAIASALSGYLSKQE